MVAEERLVSLTEGLRARDFCASLCTGFVATAMSTTISNRARASRGAYSSDADVFTKDPFDFNTLRVAINLP